MTTQKNGATIPTNGKAAPAVQPDGKGVATLQVVKPGKEEKPGDPPPLEDRLMKLNRLFDLQGKYNRLEQSLTTLKEFDLKKDGENLQLELYDENTRKRFSTKNSEVIPEIIAALRETIQKKKKAIEPLLNW